MITNSQVPTVIAEGNDKDQLVVPNSQQRKSTRIRERSMKNPVHEQDGDDFVNEEDLFEDELEPIEPTDDDYDDLDQTKVKRRVRAKNGNSIGSGKKKTPKAKIDDISSLIAANARAIREQAMTTDNMLKSMQNLERQYSEKLFKIEKNVNFLMSNNEKYQIRYENFEEIYISFLILYTYIRITHYQSFNAILLTCKLSTSSIATSSTNLYLSHATGSHHLPHHLA